MPLWGPTPGEWGSYRYIYIYIYIKKGPMDPIGPYIPIYDHIYTSMHITIYIPVHMPMHFLVSLQSHPQTNNNHTKTVPKSSQDHPRMFLQQFQKCSIIISKWFQNGIDDLLNTLPNHPKSIRK